jgi:hypothetical protein
MMFVLRVQLINGSCLIDNFVFEVPHNILILINVAPFFLIDLFPLLVAVIVYSSHIVDTLGTGFSIGLADLIDSFVMHIIQHLLSILICLLLEDEIVQSTGKPVDLHVIEE